jgi:hypothetical protein
LYYGWWQFFHYCITNTIISIIIIIIIIITTSTTALQQQQILLLFHIIQYPTTVTIAVMAYSTKYTTDLTSVQVKASLDEYLANGLVTEAVTDFRDSFDARDMETVVKVCVTT